MNLRIQLRNKSCLRSWFESYHRKLGNFDFAVFLTMLKITSLKSLTGTTDYFVDNAEEVSIYGNFWFLGGRDQFFIRPSEQLFLSLGYGLTDGEIKKHTSFSIVQTNVAHFSQS